MEKVYKSYIWENTPCSKSCSDIVVPPSKQTLVFIRKDVWLHRVYFVVENRCFLLRFYESQEEGGIVAADYSLFKDDIIIDSVISFQENFDSPEYDEHWHEFCESFLEILRRDFRRVDICEIP